MITSVTIVCVLCDQYDESIQQRIDSVQLSLEVSGLDGVMSVIDNSKKPNKMPIKYGQLAELVEIKPD
jgi:hypothetical protein